MLAVVAFLSRETLAMEVPVDLPIRGCMYGGIVMRKNCSQVSRSSNKLTTNQSTTGRSSSTLRSSHPARTAADVSKGCLCCVAVLLQEILRFAYQHHNKQHPLPQPSSSFLFLSQEIMPLSSTMSNTSSTCCQRVSMSY
jgi:hypothetical protein